MEHLRHEGTGILLIFDNATDANSIESYFPSGGDTQIIITSNAHAWRDLATPLQIDTWPNEIGADYLISRTGRNAEREAALALSNALGGLPLAHEQAAAYCERLEVPLATYHQRFEAAPVDMLDDKRDAPRAYHNRLTAAKTFALAIDEAAKLHPAAEPLIAHAALLAPEPIPLFLFSEAHEKFGEPLASALAGDNLDEAVAALRAFALIDREAIPDERNPTITTDCIRLHRLVRQVAAVKGKGDLEANAARALIEALAEVYPRGVAQDPNTWPRARRLDALAMALVAGDAPLPDGAETAAGHLLNRLAAYRQITLAAYAQARPLVERALSIHEKALVPDHPMTAGTLNNLGYLLQAQGDLVGARPYYERALAIREKALSSEHPDTALSLNNLGYLLQVQGDLAGARPYCERALAIREKALDPDDPDTALSLYNLGSLLLAQGDLAGARPYCERALAIREKVRGSKHPDTALSLNSLGALLRARRDFVGARPYYERALAIREEVLGPDHPSTARSFDHLGSLLLEQGDLAGARPYFERALAIYNKALGAAHPTTKTVAGNTARLLEALNCRKEAKALRKKFGIKG
jgi:tetratricopeptide (TPR) repeat protein